MTAVSGRCGYQSLCQTQVPWRKEPKYSPRFLRGSLNMASGGCRASVAPETSLPCRKRSWLAVACLDPETLHGWGMAQGKEGAWGMAAS